MKHTPHLLHNFPCCFVFNTRGSHSHRRGACRSVGAQQRKAELDSWLRLLKLSAALTLPVFLTAMVLPMMPSMRPILATMVAGFPLEELIKWSFTTPIQFYVAARFHMGAWRALKGGRCASSPQCCTSAQCRHCMNHTVCRLPPVMRHTCHATPGSAICMLTC